MRALRTAARLAGVAAAAGLATGPAPSASAATVRDGRYAMGTALELAVRAPDPARARAAADAAFAEVARLEALLSTFDPDSQVSRLNRAAGGPPQAVHPDLAAILVDARRWSHLTGGAFDVTVGPLVELWTAAGREGRLPSERALAAARARVDASKIHVDGDRVSLARPGMAVDLGGVAKGWALERVRQVLLRHGVGDAFVSFGQSSVLALGRPDDAPGWRLLLREPGPGFAGVVTLRDRTLSVSGSFGATSEIGGRRFGHVLDPRTGWPLTRAAQAVVLADDAGLAEALSKALLVLEPEEGIALLERLPRVEGWLALEGGERHVTDGFRRATAFEPLPAAGAAAPRPRAGPPPDPGRTGSAP